MFSYSNRTKNPLPVLAIPGSFMEFPGSLHPLGIVNWIMKTQIHDSLGLGLAAGIAGVVTKMPSLPWGCCGGALVFHPAVLKQALDRIIFW